MFYFIILLFIKQFITWRINKNFSYWGDKWYIFTHLRNFSRSKNLYHSPLCASDIIVAFFIIISKLISCEHKYFLHNHRLTFYHDGRKMYNHIFNCQKVSLKLMFLVSLPTPFKNQHGLKGWIFFCTQMNDKQV